MRVELSCLDRALVVPAAPSEPHDTYPALVELYILYAETCTLRNHPLSPATTVAVGVTTGDERLSREEKKCSKHQLSPSKASTMSAINHDVSRRPYVPHL